MIRRWGVIFGVIVIAVGLAAVGMAWQWQRLSGSSSPVAAASSIGGPFRLIDQNGRTVTDRDLLGRPSVIFFGYTYCPEFCPTTLTNLTVWLRRLGADADRLNLLFITVDPERDTPKQMRAFLSAFDPRIRGLTGSPDAIAKAARAYSVYYRKAPLGGGEYGVDHSTAIYLMDAKGRFATVIGYGEPPEQALASLKRLLHP